MNVWNFREYQSVEGTLPVSEWYEKLSPRNKAKAKRFIGIARKLERLEMPDFKSLRGKKFKGLLEARWRGDNKVPHRIFCYASSGRQVIFLCGCTHKGNRYTPTNARETAVKRRKEIQDERASTRELDL